MSPKDPCYFDFGYSRNSTRRLYEWEPVGKECTNTQAHLVKGGQANLWTEFITTSDEVERMLYPRTCALAETLWNTKEKKEWEGFRQRISKFGAIMEKLNICYFKDEDWDNTGFVPQSEHNWLKSCHLITISERIAHLAQALGWQQVTVCPCSDNRTLLQTLLQCC